MPASRKQLTKFIMKCEQKSFVAGYSLYSAVMIAMVFASLALHKAAGAPKATTMLVVVEATLLLLVPFFVDKLDLYPFSSTFMKITTAIYTFNVWFFGLPYIASRIVLLRPYDPLNGAPLIDTEGLDPANWILYQFVDYGMFVPFFALATALYNIDLCKEAKGREE